MMKTLPSWISSSREKAGKEDKKAETSALEHIQNLTVVKQGKKTQESLVLYDQREARGAWHHESFKGFIFQKEGVISLGHGYNKRPSIMKTKIWSLYLVRLQSVKTLKKPVQWSRWGQKPCK